jgi:hypothetical protein
MDPAPGERTGCHVKRQTSRSAYWLSEHGSGVGEHQRSAWEWRRVMRKPCQAKKATSARQMIPARWMYELAPLLTFGRAFAPSYLSAFLNGT